ncbi:MAG: HAD family hydrolase [Staphylococcus rostri]|uniref:HAD family hydrolase n=1 Tax=Staphylococcus rostri TaxID=522262 RepID=UPI0026E100B8|nr:HAD family hydrolase [Staphylococcus rostri]MDO5375081.1 HAD family hydrolase [Staphylococcus rostri]
MKNIYFDLDDTLIQTQEAYAYVNNPLSQMVSAETEYRPTEVMHVMNKIDIGKIATLSFSPDRYCNSWVETFHKLMPSGSYNENEIYKIASSIFTMNIPLHSDAKAVLSEIKYHKYPDVKLNVLTHGDKSIQMKRIDDLNLQALFDDICIVDHKDVNTYRQLSSGKDIMIGNSINHDVIPSIESGWNAYHIKRKLSWDYDGKKQNSDYDFESFQDLRDIWQAITRNIKY